MLSTLRRVFRLSISRKNSPPYSNLNKLFIPVLTSSHFTTKKTFSLPFFKESLISKSLEDEKFSTRRPFSNSKFEGEKQPGKQPNKQGEKQSEKQLGKDNLNEDDSFMNSAEDLQKILIEMNYKDRDLKEDSKKWFQILKEKKLLSKENIGSSFEKWNTKDEVKQSRIANEYGLPRTVLDKLVNWAIPPISSVDIKAEFDKIKKTLKDPSQKTSEGFAFDFKGREEEIKKFTENLVKHFSAYHGGLQLKKKWRLYGVTGGSGTGKTRFSMCVQEHILKELEKTDYSKYVEGERKETILNSLKNSLKRNIVIKTDFTNGDYFDEWKDPNLMAKSVLITLLSKSFIPALKISQTLDQFPSWKNISLESGASALHNFYGIPEEEDLTIFFVVDEFQKKVSEEDVEILRTNAKRENIFIRKLSVEFMTLCQKLKSSKIFLVPIFCGTFSIQYLNIFPATEYSMINFPLGPLKPEDSFQIIQEDLKYDLPKSLIETTGNIPRALEYLVEAYNKVADKRAFKEIYKEAISLIDNRYPSSFSEPIFKKLVEYCLAGKILFSEDEKIENIPIGTLKGDGVIFYEPLSDLEADELRKQNLFYGSKEKAFRIFLPLLFAEVFNSKNKIFDPRFLTYKHDISFQGYEQFSRDFKVFKNNFFFKTLKISETTYGELFYGAIMSEKRKKQKIKLTEMTPTSATTDEFPQDSKITVTDRMDSIDVTKGSYGVWIGRNCTIADSIFSYPNQSDNKTLICFEKWKSSFVYTKVKDDKIRPNEIIKECEDAGLLPRNNKKNHFSENKKYDLMLHFFTNLYIPSLSKLEEKNGQKVENKNIKALNELIDDGKLMIISREEWSSYFSSIFKPLAMLQEEKEEERQKKEEERKK